MARNGSGTYSRPVSAYTPNTDILSSDVNDEMDDMATEISNSIAADGQTTPTGNLPMGSYRHTGVGNASARNHYAAAGQVQDGAFLWAGTAAGTADARTIAPTPAITAYAAGQMFRFINGAAANTGAATLAVSGLTATAVRKGEAATALAAGDLPADAVVEVVHDGTVFRLLAVQPSGIGVTAMRAANVTALGAVDLTGGTMTGTLSVTGSINVYGPAASGRIVQFSTAAGNRWRFLADSTAEAGANAGSDMALEAYNDAGALIGEVFDVTRASRVLDFKVTPTINGVAVSTAVGTITGVTAGTGITGGGTSGAVTVNVATTYGALGTYAFLANNTGGTITAGTTTAGTNLNPPQSGTWRNMGADAGTGASSVWLRTA